MLDIDIHESGNIWKYLCDIYPAFFLPSLTLKDPKGPNEANASQSSQSSRWSVASWRGRDMKKMGLSQKMSLPNRW